MSKMTIGNLAAACGVGVETVRFYQRRGLMQAPAKMGGFRHYDDADVKRLSFIRQAQRAGFTLSQIEELVRLDPQRDRGEVLHLARERLAEIEARLAELESVKAALSKLARQCESGAGDCCPILEAFETSPA